MRSGGRPHPTISLGAAARLPPRVRVVPRARVLVGRSGRPYGCERANDSLLRDPGHAALPHAARLHEVRRGDEVMSNTPPDQASFAEACDWFVRLREAPESPQLITDWLAWCRTDPRNGVMFEEVRSLWWATRDVEARLITPVALERVAAARPWERIRRVRRLATAA